MTQSFATAGLRLRSSAGAVRPMLPLSNAIQSRDAVTSLAFGIGFALWPGARGLSPRARPGAMNMQMVTDAPRGVATQILELRAGLAGRLERVRHRPPVLSVRRRSVEAFDEIAMRIRAAVVNAPPTCSRRKGDDHA